ncbi:TPA: hypothetical protein DDW35_04175 [Candidatus Sumerlaeota bacterium]|jgi:hypothetical protein|nr:hypothetical protein [Candidatus Sumerlaeota bacterium]
MRSGAKNFFSIVVAFVGMSAGIINSHAETNPLFRDAFTADPAPMVYKDTVYLYVGHDEANDKEMFNMKDWLCYSSKDMQTWTAHGTMMKPTDFKWAVKDAWAAQVVEKGGKFYFYVTVHHDPTHGGKAIGVAVADSPTGPFVDARGSALVTEEMTPSPNGWDDIDPTIFIDDDGTPWLAWGNPNCYMVKLKPNMTELDGPIQKINLPNYTEAPWLHKHGSTYYLIYAAFAHQGMGEKVCYATAPKISGPWTYQGILTDSAKSSYTIHPGVIDFKGQGYFFYHNATLTLNGQKGAIGRRAVCMEYMYYNPDGTIQPITQTAEGVSVPPKSGAPGNTPKKAEGNVVSDPGVKVTQNTAPGATSWPDKPIFVTTDNPWNSVQMDGASFNEKGGAENLGQTFTVGADCQAKRISIYGGDGFGTDAKNPVTLALYDLGIQSDSTPAHTYTAETNLLGNGKGLRIAYQVQATGLLHFDLADKVELKANHTYVFELQGVRNSAALFWRRTKKDTYPKGAAYQNRSLMDEKSKCDFVMAVYGTSTSN